MKSGQFVYVFLPPLCKLESQGHGVGSGSGGSVRNTEKQTLVVSVQKQVVSVWKKETLQTWAWTTDSAPWGPWHIQLTVVSTRMFSSVFGVIYTVPQQRVGARLPQLFFVAARPHVSHHAMQPGMTSNFESSFAHLSRNRGYRCGPIHSFYVVLRIEPRSSCSQEKQLSKLSYIPSPKPSFLLTVKWFWKRFSWKTLCKVKCCTKSARRLHSAQVCVYTHWAFYFSITSPCTGKYLSSWYGSLPCISARRVLGGLFWLQGVFLICSANYANAVQSGRCQLTLHRQ